MIEIDNFYNDGFGWVCKPCAAELEEVQPESHSKLSRIMREGEAESKQPRLSNVALAKWADNVRNTLKCPHCGSTEQIDKA